jgi:chromosome segregation ATPase
MMEGEFEELRVVLVSAKVELVRVRWEGRVCTAEAKKD